MIYILKICQQSAFKMPKLFYTVIFLGYEMSRPIYVLFNSCKSVLVKKKLVYCSDHESLSFVNIFFIMYFK